MIGRTPFADYLEQLLKCSMHNDYAPNGLQVEGKSSIHRICTAVTASKEAIERAVAYKADALLVHHGYFWKGEQPVITGMKRERIRLLLAHDINLFAYHLPLDTHPELGNNACLGKALAFAPIRSVEAGGVPNLLWIGELPKPIAPNTLHQRLAIHFAREPLHISSGDSEIKTVAWCTGGAQDFITDAHTHGADAYISGEVSERTYHQAKELGIHYFACGHHATEKAGIRALGERAALHFGLEHQFLDSDNPV